MKFTSFINFVTTYIQYVYYCSVRTVLAVYTLLLKATRRQKPLTNTLQNTTVAVLREKFQTNLTFAERYVHLVLYII